ncbi:ABC transporter ATP-binding protein [Faecalibaculum rodentium]|uniref:ABC transporter ATP-binding protein n=1 Tax=Faecalibaculum rodentium TaxID=1702221 RepID=UPI00272A8AB6|nr:ABC transporter ATP-binding protein [Faecalibaculum rodentium]
MLKVLLAQVKEYKADSIKTPILVMGEVVFDVLIPFLMALLVDEGINKGDIHAILLYAGLMLASAIIALILGGLSGKYAAIASCGFAKNVRDAEFRNIQNFAFEDIDKFSTGGLITRMMTDVNNLQMAYQMIIRVAVRTPFMMLASLFMIFSASSRLGWWIVAILIVLAILIFGMMKLVHPIFMKMFKKYDKLNEFVQENTTGIRAVKSFVREGFQTAHFDEASQDIYKVNKRAEKILVLNQPVMMLAVYSSILLVCWVGAQQVVDGSMQVGSLMSLFTYIMTLLMSLMMFSMVFIQIIMSMASARRVVEVITQVSSLQSPADGVKEVRNGEIVFDHVRFNYAENPNDPYILDDVNVTIPSGSSFGILGATGSGKTSFVQLIPRLYDVTSGEVRVSGLNVKDYDLKCLRDKVAMVLQKNVLFSGSIIDNMRWGAEDATLDEIREVCHLAQADEFIEKMPDKYNTYIEQGGTNVSGGQRQRLTIARALLKKPKILILDDSTSAVDTRTDQLIREAFQTKIPDTTRIIISQRVSSIQDSDLIMVLNEGKVEATGTHEELLKTCPIYQQTYEQQQKGGDFDEQ